MSRKRNLNALLILVFAVTFGCAEDSLERAAVSPEVAPAAQPTDPATPQTNVAVSDVAGVSAADSDITAAERAIPLPAGEAQSQSSEANVAAADEAAAEPTAEFRPLESLWSVDTDEYEYTTAFALSPQTGMVAVGSSKLQLWKLGQQQAHESSEPLTETFGFADIADLDFATDGSQLAVGLGDDSVAVWDIRKQETVLELNAHAGGVTSVAFAPDGQTLATAGFDNEVRLWNLADGEQLAAFSVQDQAQADVSFSADGRMLAACGQQVHVWNLDDGAVLHQFSNEFQARCSGAEFSPNGQVLAVAEMTAQVQLWDLQTGQKLASCAGAEGPIDQVIWSADGARVIARCTDYTVRIWDAASGRQLQTIDLSDEANTISVVGIGWLPDPGLLVMVTEPGELSVWGPPATSFPTDQLTVRADAAAADSSSAEAVTVNKIAIPETAAAEVPEQPVREVTPATAESAVNLNPETEPAHVIDAVKLLDLRTMPFPPGTDGANDDPTSLHYHDIGSAAEALTFYDSWFAENGWQDITSRTNRGDGRVFEKNGFRVYANASHAPLGCMLTVMHQGNYDARWLPMPADAEDIGVSDFGNVWVVSASGHEPLEQDLQQRFRDQSWHLVSRHTFGNDVMLELIRNGIRAHLRLTDSVNYPNRTMLQYGVSMLRAEAPIPDDASDLQFEDSPLRFSLTTAMSVDEAAEFYEQGMQTLNWTADHNPDEKSESAVVLRFHRDRDDAEVSIRTADDGSTRVTGQASAVPSDALVAAAQRAQQRSQKRDEQQRQDAMAALKQAIPVAEFPVPDAATDVFRNPHGSASGGDIRFNTTSEPSAVMKFYRDTLTAQDWQEDTRETHDRDGFGQLVFRKQQAEIRIRVNSSGEPGQYFGMIEGNGLLAENDPRQQQDGEPAEAAADAGPSEAELAELQEMLQTLSAVPGLENFNPPPPYQEWLKENELQAGPESMQKYVEEVQALLQQLGQAAAP